jgi:hypothetical protein
LYAEIYNSIDAGLIVILTIMNAYLFMLPMAIRMYGIGKTAYRTASNIALPGMVILMR